jgi:farnesyl diphosphate synthase
VDLAEIKDTLLIDFEAFLQENLPSAPSFHLSYDRALKEMFEAGGKRFRPLMLLQVVESFQPLLVKNSYFIALAVEMIHTYSLIHDDLPTFDDADLRRGHPTLHISYDEVTATLVGDALNTHSFLLIADAPFSSDIKIELIRELSLNSGTRGMVLGQAIDCYFEDKILSISELRFLHIHKTAKLIACSLKMGAIIVGLDKDKQNLLYEIGLNIGLLFQVQDDIIDATYTSQKAGKPTNNDNSKNSYTNLLGIDGAKKEKNELILKVEAQIDKLDIEVKKRLLSSVDRYFKG